MSILNCTFITAGKDCLTFPLPPPHFCLCHTSNLISFQDSNNKRLQSPECLGHGPPVIVVQDGEIIKWQLSMSGEKPKKMVGHKAPCKSGT